MHLLGKVGGCELACVSEGGCEDGVGKVRGGVPSYAMTLYSRQVSAR